MGKPFFGDEWDKYALVIIILTALLINFNPTLAMIYIALWLASFIIFSKGYNKYPFYKSGNILLKLIHGGVHYLIFIYIAPFVLVRTGYTDFNTPLSVAKLVASTNPALAGSSILVLFAFTLLIPRVETVLVGRLLNWFGDEFKVNLNVFGIKLIGLFVLIAGTYVFFHITAKGIANNAALLVVFIFFFYQCALIWYYREAFQAFIQHAIANGVAIYLVTFSIAALTVPIFGINPMLIFIAIGIYAIWKFKLIQKLGVAS